jgi:hypothetical protein
MATRDKKSQRAVRPPVPTGPQSMLAVGQSSNSARRTTNTSPTRSANNNRSVTSYGKNSQYARGKRETVAYLKANPNATIQMINRALNPTGNIRKGSPAALTALGARVNVNTSAYRRGMSDAIKKIESGTPPKRSAAQTTAKAITANRKAGVTAASHAAVKAKKKKAAARMEGQALGAVFNTIYPKKNGK